MKFCSKLLNAINFEPHALSPCCAVRGIRIPELPYKGGRVDLAAYGRHIAKTICDIQEGGEVCRGCPELVEHAGAPHLVEGRFQTVSINMHRYFCNCKCVYCHLWNQPDKGVGYPILPGLASLHAQEALEKTCSIHWGGGEPSILPDFDAASEWGMRHGYFQYVHTNAIRFSRPLASVLEKGMGLLNVSLDSGSPGVYEKVKGVNVFDRVVENLKNYIRAAPGALDLKYIVFEANNSPAEIEKFLRLARELNVRRVQYSLNFLETNAGALSEKTLLAAALLQARARRLGLRCEPGFIDKKQLEKIDALAGGLQV